MSTAILYNAPSGFPGDVSRSLDTQVKPIELGEAFTAFGQAFKFDPTTGKAMMIDSGDAATVFAGILARSVPQQGGNANQGFDDAIPNADQPNGGVIKGYCMVVCSVGTPVNGQPVYMRITADTGKLVGDLETAADSGKCVAIDAVWASNGKDASNVAEIYIK